MIVTGSKRVLKPSTRVELDWSAPINRGLTGYWLGWEGAGNTIEDMTGNRLALTGDQPWVQTIEGCAKGGKDGAGHYLTNASYTQSASVTFAIRIYLTAVATDRPGNMMSVQSTYSSAGIGLWVGYINSTDPFFSVGGNLARASTGLIATGNYYTLVGTYDGTTIRLYLNGYEVANLAYAGGVGTQSHNLWMGSEQLNNPQYIWAGTWNRALSAEEVKSLHFDQYQGLQGSKLLDIGAYASTSAPPSGGFLNRNYWWDNY